jgi:RNA polymerase primary sigma factor
MAKSNMAEPAETVETGDAPLIDMNDASIKKVIARAKKRGYITYDQLNEALPQGEMSSDQIEDISAALSEMGINIVDNEEAGEDGEAEPAKEDDDEPEAADAEADTGPAIEKKKETCIFARWARSSCSAARARSRSPSASRPAATR